MQKFKELCARSDGKFIPTSPLDFVGDGVNKHGSAARAVANHVYKIVHQAKASGNLSLKVLLNGPPGIGKTAMALYFQHLLGCDKWSTSKYNGTQMKVEVIEDLARSLFYRGLFGEYRILHIDEADEIPRVAQVRFLSLLDDLPDGVAVICTSNCKIKDFEPRFQSRFQAFELIPPTTEEIETLLLNYIDPANAKQIALFSAGNVRAALLDAKGVMQENMLTK